MSDMKDRLQEAFSAQKIYDHLIGKLLPDVIVAAIVFFAFYILWRVLERAMGLLERTDIDRTARAFLSQIVKYSVFTLGIVAALGQLGVNTTSLLASLGVAGLTLGFAARDTLSNLISGIFIFWDRPFVVGDLIEIGDKYGRVDEITLRSTRVVTVDGRMLAIPNTQIVNSVVASYTNFPSLRLDIDFTVAVTENLGRARDTVLAVLKDDERFLSDPGPKVVVTALNDYNVAMQLRVWVEDERSHIVVRMELREAIFEALRDANVEMPYETFALEPVEMKAPAA